MSEDHGIIEFVRYGGFGDLLMATCVLPGLRAAGFRSRIVCKTYFSPVLVDNPYLDELVLLNETTMEAVDAAVAPLEPARHRVLLNYAASAFGLHHPFGFPDHPIALHATTHFCQMLGLPPNDVLSLELPPDILDWGAEFQDTVLIQTTAHYSPYKNWSIDRWEALSARITADYGCRVLHVGGPDDTPVPGIERLLTGDIRQAFAAIAHCRLFIGLDSVFNHASRALKKPSIILWGSTNPLAYGYAQNINLVNGVAWEPFMGNHGPLMHCQPCYREYKQMNDALKPVCPYTVANPIHVLPQDWHPQPSLHACMANNTVDGVYYHVRQMLGPPSQGE